jgi:hypothetical protein
MCSQAGIEESFASGFESSGRDNYEMVTPFLSERHVFELRYGSEPEPAPLSA